MHGIYCTQPWAASRHIFLMSMILNSPRSAHDNNLECSMFYRGGSIVIVSSIAAYSPFSVSVYLVNVPNLNCVLPFPYSFCHGARLLAHILSVRLP